MAKRTNRVAWGPDLPRLFRERSVNSATLAMAVNYFVALGEETAVRELNELPADKSAERVGWVCRVLFEPKGRNPLRPPGYGSLYLPAHSMPPEKWPLYPVALSGSSYFILSEGHVLEGVPEHPTHYIAYCRENGTFRKVPVNVPTRGQALKDVAALRQSEAWKAIKWEEPWYYRMDESWTWSFIQAQAESIPTR